jgi:hypothetical protein
MDPIAADMPAPIAARARPFPKGTLPRDAERRRGSMNCGQSTRVSHLSTFPTVLFGPDEQSKTPRRNRGASRAIAKRGGRENLLDNAWKFTAKRADAIVRMGKRLADDKTVFFVQDNGAGFDMHQDPSGGDPELVGRRS